METVIRELDDIDWKLEEAVNRMDKYWVHEFFPHRCPRCNNVLATEASLRRHIATSKRCKQFGEEKRQ